MSKYILLLAIVTCVIFAKGELEPKDVAYSTPPHLVQIQTISASATPTFGRGFTNKQGQPCDDERGGVDYKSQILSREEVMYELTSVGFKGQTAEWMAAVSLAESGRQVSCIADEHLVNEKWDVSYGVYSIRALKADQGKGTCRDIERLRKDDFHDQTVCAWEISGQGRNLGPWSTYPKKARQYLGK